MNFKEFNDVFNTDFNLSNILAVRQNWRAEHKFSCIEAPRRNIGLLMITDYPVFVELSDGSSFQADVGDVLLLPKGARYIIRFLVPQGKVSHPVVVNFVITTESGEEVNLESNAMRLCRDNGALLPLFQAATQHYKSAPPSRLKGAVFELLGRLFPVQEEDECGIAYINRNYTDRFHIPDLAKRCGMSEPVYRKRFKQLTGCSPVQYINRMKINKACQMLCNTEMTPASISGFLRFNNLPYFYKVFKDITGLTPSQYIEQKK